MSLGRNDGSKLAVEIIVGIVFLISASYGVPERIFQFLLKIISKDGSTATSSSTGFLTVFEATRSLAPWWLSPNLAIALLMVAAAVLFATRPNANTLNTVPFPRLLERVPRWIWRGLLAFALAYTTLSFYERYTQPQVSLLEDSPFHTVEGNVYDFKTGAKLETFAVKDRAFSYSDYVYTGGFHTTQAHGGPIKDGEYVRVSFRGNKILKLEVRGMH